MMYRAARRVLPSFLINNHSVNREAVPAHGGAFLPFDVGALRPRN